MTQQSLARLAWPPPPDALTKVLGLGDGSTGWQGRWNPLRSTFPDLSAFSVVRGGSRHEKIHRSLPYSAPPGSSDCSGSLGAPPQCPDAGAVGGFQWRPLPRVASADACPAVAGRQGHHFTCGRAYASLLRSEWSWWSPVFLCPDLNCPLSASTITASGSLAVWSGTSKCIYERLLVKVVSHPNEEIVVCTWVLTVSAGVLFRAIEPFKKV